MSKLQPAGWAGLGGGLEAVRGRGRSWRRGTVAPLRWEEFREVRAWDWGLSRVRTGRLGDWETGV